MSSLTAMSPPVEEVPCRSRKSMDEGGPMQTARTFGMLRSQSAGSMLLDRMVTSLRWLARPKGQDADLPEVLVDLKCDRGHVMSARIYREVVGACCGPMHSRCLHCEARIDVRRHGCYRCHICDIEYCMPCSKQLAGERGVGAWEEDASPNRPKVGPGDIILTGPCLTVHHVILCVGPMERTEDAREALGTRDGVDLYVCMTVESTPFYRDCLVGKEHGDGKGNHWESYLHRGYCYFQRSPATGEMSLVGVKPWRSHEPPKPVDPQYTKFLLHPFRERHGGPALDLTTFYEAVRLSELRLMRYSVSTCLKAVRAERASLDPALYPDPHSQIELLAEVRRRWESKPICASVAITVWQRYIELHCGATGGPGGEGGADPMRVVQGIFDWMPVLSDTTTPSTLVKVLTARHWILRDNLCFSGESGSTEALGGAADEAAAVEEMGSMMRPPTTTMRFSVAESSQERAPSGDGSPVGAPDGDAAAGPAPRSSLRAESSGSLAASPKPCAAAPPAGLGLWCCADGRKVHDPSWLRGRAAAAA